MRSHRNSAAGLKKISLSHRRMLRGIHKKIPVTFLLLIKINAHLYVITLANYSHNHLH